MHYKAYHDVNHLDTTEDDRPSLKIKQNKPATKHATVDVEVPQASSEPDASQVTIMPFADSLMCSVQTARSIVTCIECTKPRVIYSRQKLSERQNVSVVISLSEYDYTCGSALLPPSHPLAHKIMCRDNLSCATPVEIPFYGSGIGRLDICCFCGTEGGEVDTELKRKYKTVLPICHTCRENGKLLIVQRPYGRGK